MLDISKFVTVDENGKAVIDTKAFESAYDSELRKSLDSNSANTRKKLEDEIRKSLEEEAKLTAEEKLKKEREDFEADMAKRMKDFAQKQAKSLMSAQSLAEDEINTYLELVHSDEDIAKIEKLLETRKASIETMKQQWQNDIMNKQPDPNNNNNNGGETSFGKAMAEKYQNRTQSNETKVTAWGN